MVVDMAVDKVVYTTVDMVVDMVVGNIDVGILEDIGVEDIVDDDFVVG